MFDQREDRVPTREEFEAAKRQQAEGINPIQELSKQESQTPTREAFNAAKVKQRSDSTRAAATFPADKGPFLDRPRSDPDPDPGDDTPGRVGQLVGALAGYTTPSGLGEFATDIGRSLKKSALSLGQSFEATMASLPVVEGGNENTGRMSRTRRAGQENRAETIANVVKLQKAIEAIPENEALQEFAGAGNDFGKMLDAFVKDPAGLVGSAVAGSAFQSIPAILFGAVGGVPGVMAGTALTEYGARFVAELQRAGVDLTDEAALTTALDNRDLVSRASLRAGAQAATVAAVEGVTGKIGSKIAGSARLKDSPVIRKGVEFFTESGGEGTGEGGATLVAGDELDAANIALESMAGGTQSLGSVMLTEVRTGAVRDARAKVKIFADLQNVPMEDLKRIVTSRQLSEDEMEILITEVGRRFEQEAAEAAAQEGPLAPGQLPQPDQGFQDEQAQELATPEQAQQSEDTANIFQAEDDQNRVFTPENEPLADPAPAPVQALEPVPEQPINLPDKGLSPVEKAQLEPESTAPVVEATAPPSAETTTPVAPPSAEAQAAAQPTAVATPVAPPSAEAQPTPTQPQDTRTDEQLDEVITDSQDDQEVSAAIDEVLRRQKPTDTPVADMTDQELEENTNAQVSDERFQEVMDERARRRDAPEGKTQQVQQEQTPPLQERARAVASTLGLPEITVVQNQEQLPDDIKAFVAEAKQENPDLITPGVHWTEGNKAFFVVDDAAKAKPDGVTMEQFMQDTMLHESLGHQGLQANIATDPNTGKFDPDRYRQSTNDLFDKLKPTLEGNKSELFNEVRDLVEKRGYIDGEGGQPISLDDLTPAQRSLFADEFFAHVAELEGQGILDASTMKKILDAIRAWYQEATGKPLTEAGARKFLRDNAKALKKGREAQQSSTSESSTGSQDPDSDRTTAGLDAPENRPGAVFDDVQATDENMGPKISFQKFENPNDLDTIDRIHPSEAPAGFLIAADRMGTHDITLTDGSPYRLRGGPFYPQQKDTAGKAAWAGDARGSMKTFMDKIMNTPSGVGKVILMGDNTHMSNMAVSEAFLLEAAIIGEQEFLQRFNRFLREEIHQRAKDNTKKRKYWIEAGEVQSLSDLRILLRATFPGRLYLMAKIAGFGSNPKIPLHHDRILKEYGLPDVFKIVNDTRDPRIDGLPYGSVVSVVEFDKEQTADFLARDYMPSASDLGVPDHVAYDYPAPAKEGGLNAIYTHAVDGTGLYGADPYSEGYLAGIRKGEIVTRGKNPRRVKLSEKRQRTQLVRQGNMATLIAKVGEDTPMAKFSRRKGGPFRLTPDKAPVTGTGTGGRITVGDVGKVLNKATVEEYGQLLPTSPVEDRVRRFVELASEDLIHQLQQPKSGFAWYTEDVAIFEEGALTMYPELSDPVKMDLYKTIVGFISNGNKPSRNLQIANRIWDEYRVSAVLSKTDPTNGEVWGREAIGKQVERLGKLIDREGGVEQAIQWLQSPKTGREIKQLGGGGTLKVNQIYPGSYTFGPKLGNFILNLSGIDTGTTIDSWFSRTWNRYMGTLLLDANPKSGLRDSPRNSHERNAIQQAVESLSEIIGLAPANIQAVLWYYEQQYYKSMGTKTESQDYARSQRKEVASRGIDTAQIDRSIQSSDDRVRGQSESAKVEAERRLADSGAVDRGIKKVQDRGASVKFAQRPGESERDAVRREAKDRHVGRKATRAVERVEEGNLGEGRPDLSQIVEDEGTRDLVRATDTERQDTELITEQSVAQWKAQATQDLERDYDGWRDRMLKGGPMEGGTEVIRAKMIIEQEGRDVLKEINTDWGRARAVELATIVYNYRAARTEIARALGAGFDPSLTPGQRAEQFVMDAVFTPSSEQMRDRKKWQRTAKPRIEREVREAQVKADKLGGKVAELQVKSNTILNRIAQKLAEKTAILTGQLAQSRDDGGPGKFAQRSREQILQEDIDQLRKEHRGVVKQLNAAKTLHNKALDTVQRLKDVIKTKEAKILAEAATDIGRLTASLKKAGLDSVLDTITDEDAINNQEKLAWAVRLASAQKASKWDKGYEYWINGLLSSPTTHAANIVGNGLNLFYNHVLRAGVSGAISDARRLLGQDVATDERSLKDFMVIAKYWDSVKIGSIWSRARMAWRTEVPQLAQDLGIVDRFAKSESYSASIGSKFRKSNKDGSIKEYGGRQLRWPGRALVWGDEIFKGMSVQAGGVVAAFHQGKALGLEGDALDAYMKEQLANPHSESFQTAYLGSLEDTFQEDNFIADAMSKAMSNGARSDNAGMRYAARLGNIVIPFKKTPLNVIGQGLRKSPLGILQAVPELVRYKMHGKAGLTHSKAQYADKMAEQIIAWGIVTTLGVLLSGTDEDELPFITGSPPASRAAQKAMREGRAPQAQSILINGTYYSYARYEPFATMLTLSVDGVNAALGRSTWSEAAGSVISVVRDKSFLMGVADIVEAAFEPERQGVRWTSKVASSMMPNIIKTLARATDSTFHEYSKAAGRPDDRGAYNEFGSYTTDLLYKSFPVPGLANSPGVDPWGRDVEKASMGNSVTDFFYRITVPSWVQDVDRMTKLDQAILVYNNHNEHEYWPSKVPRSIGDRVLTDEEYYAHSKRSGEIAMEKLKPWIDARPVGTFSALTEDDMEFIRTTLNDARKVSKASLFPDHVQEQALVRSGVIE